MKKGTYLIYLALLLCPWLMGGPFRVATYNIKFLDANNLSGEHQANLKAVIHALHADVIALQEIKDRAALEAIFNKNEWHLIIDDDSQDGQDLALAVRTGIQVQMVGKSGNADDGDFLFPEKDPFFPKRRDVLRIGLVIPGTTQKVWVLVHHGKARVEGRATTAPRRMGAAKAILPKLRALEKVPLILLGDFNDSPDDASLNILESGDPKAKAEMENRPGPFMFNLTERLWAQDLVSMGWKSGSQQLQISRPGVRRDSFKLVDSDDYPRGAHSALLDNILINQAMNTFYVQGSIGIFQEPTAATASDHLPVFADFQFGGPEMAKSERLPVSVKIAALLPDPPGRDEGREQISLKNVGKSLVDLQGWSVRDLSGHLYLLRGRLAAGGVRTFSFDAKGFSLNNGGDEISLLDKEGRVVWVATYRKEQVKVGEVIGF